MTEEINQAEEIKVEETKAEEGAEEVKVEEGTEEAQVTQKMENVEIPEPPVADANIISAADVKNWCMFCHVSAFCALISVPPVVGPLVIWLIKKDVMPEVDKHGKEAINFQLSMLIYAIVCAITVVGMILIPVVGILWLIFTIMASVKASHGEFYRYPLTIRFLK
jgi:uncharacterized protein